MDIGRRYLVPQALEKNCLSDQDITITSSAMENIINWYCQEAGVRLLNQKIEAICRKIAVDHVNRDIAESEDTAKEKIVINGDWDTLTH
jgi:ATP-dependent Lon protease